MAERETGERREEEGPSLGPSQVTRVKKGVRMRAFPASGANFHVPPQIEIIRCTKTN